jgi:hypothetical protein
VFAKGNLIACDNSVGMLCGSRYKSHVFVNEKNFNVFMSTVLTNITRDH